MSMVTAICNALALPYRLTNNKVKIANAYHDIVLSALQIPVLIQDATGEFSKGSDIMAAAVKPPQMDFGVLCLPPMPKFYYR